MPCKSKGFLLKAVEKSYSQVPNVEKTRLDESRNFHGDNINDGRSSNLSNTISDSTTITDNNIKFDKNQKELNDKLVEELYSAKGQLKVAEERHKSIINQKNELIKSLETELLTTKNDSSKLIKNLQSQLQFKDASIHEAHQESMSLKSVNDSMSESFRCDSGQFPKLTTVSPYRGRKRIDHAPDSVSFKSQPAKKLKASSGESDKVKSKNVPMQISPLAEISSAAVMKETKDSSIAVVMDKNENAPPPTKRQHSENKVSLNETSRDPVHVEPNELTEAFNFSLNIFDKFDYGDLLNICEIRHPKKCCVSINYDEMFGWCVKTMQNVVSVLKFCMHPFGNLGSPDKEAINKVNNCLSHQFKLLLVSLKRRQRSIDRDLEHLFSRTMYEKSDLLKNPQYSCLFHYLYPLSEVIKKLSVMATYRLSLVVDILTNCILPNFFDIVNYLFIDCCCFEQTDDDSSRNCNTRSSGFENVFIKEILNFCLYVISQSSNGARSNIFDKFLLSFKKLIPLFASEMDLKVVVLDLFFETLNYSKFVSMISQHKGNRCELFFIMDLLNCKCIADCSQAELIRFANHISRIILSLCKMEFKWKQDCSCTSETFSLMANLCWNLSKHVCESQWTDSNKQCMQHLLIACNQMKISSGPNIFLAFTQQRTYVEFRSLFDYLMDSQLPLLLEDLWPSEYKWFYQLLEDLQ